MKYTLPTDSAERKNYPVADGPLSYFPAAIAGVAHVCKLGNDKHNPGQPLHHARGKSGDHANCIVRHLMDVNDLRAYLERNGEVGNLTLPQCEETARAILHEVNQLAWRALALAQELHEAYGGAPLAPGARLPEVPAGTDLDAAADSVINQITAAPAPGLDYSHEMPTDPTRERDEWPPVFNGPGTRYPSVWGYRGSWYFEVDSAAQDHGGEEQPFNQSYPTEAEARAAYWRWKDAQPSA